MHRSSESIASLAGALAKAQAQLVNPEKSLVGTVRLDSRSDAERSFRYAPLSSGLDIVRKTLGLHEIATLQTTAIDRPAGIVNLTTVLAHSSGEWIASDWPVCSLSETATPRRMGAALTYARRYALFTLVGIAGEDDLDAADLNPPLPQATGAGSSSSAGTNKNGPGNGVHRPAGGPALARRDPKGVASTPRLDPNESASLRDQLLQEIDALPSPEAAASWARRVMGAKNGLVDADARLVEEKFQSRLMVIAPADAGSGDFEKIAAIASAGSQRGIPEISAAPTAIDKSQLALPEPRRLRDKVHLRFVSTQPCLVCGRRPSDAHHLRFAQHPALGRKVSDEFTVPVCRTHHREIHRSGDEAAWWERAGIDVVAKARALWSKTHPVGGLPDNGNQSGAGLGTTGNGLA